MKKLLSDGNELIVSSRLVSFSSQFDKWNTHGVEMHEIGSNRSAAGADFGFISFTLKSTGFWYYRLTDGMFEPESDQWIEAIGLYYLPSGAGPYFGEWWNWIERKKVLDKLRFADWLAFLASH